MNDCDMQELSGSQDGFGGDLRFGEDGAGDHDAGGCGAGANINSMGGPQPGDHTVGAGGGDGGIYCFALTP